MPSIFRDFWFPFLLALAGFPLALFSISLTENGRRTMLTLALILFFLAALSAIWGDPVRGPFANLTSPHDAKHFTIMAGVGVVMPVSQLKDGVNFSKCCIGLPGQPIELWVRKTWWSGLYVKFTLKGHGGKPMLIFDNKKIQYEDSAIDVNYDDYAFEVVSPAKAPSFQLVIAKDYSTIYINARLMSQNAGLVLKNNRLALINPNEIDQPEYRLDRIFKYPSYVHQGERD